MKRIYISATFVLLALNGLIAQNSNLVIFSKQGENFNVILNGVIQNDGPSSNVKITDLSGEYMAARVVFSNPELGEVSKNVMLETDSEVTYILNKNKKGKYVLKGYGSKPIESTTTEPSQNIVVYHTSPSSPESLSTRTTTTTTTTSSSKMDDNNNNNNVNVNTNLTGKDESVKMNLSISDSSASFNVDININGMVDQNTNIVNNEETVTTTTVVEETTIQPEFTKSETSLTLGCSTPMFTEDYSEGLESIQKRSFDDEKLVVAKQLIRNNCLNVEQVRGIMQAFSFDEEKLSIAKYAYEYTIDQNNYYLLNDEFEYDKEVKQLNSFLKSKGR